MKRFVFIMLLLHLLTPYSLRLTPAVLMAQSLSEINKQWLERKEAELRWGRDPFVLPRRPTGGGMEAEGEFHLSAIIYRAGRGVAIINNKILRPGDMIEGRRVAEIREDRVVLQDAVGKKELRVNKVVLGQ